MKKILVIGAGGAAKREIIAIRELVPESEIAVWETGKTKCILEDIDTFIYTKEEAVTYAPEVVVVETPTSTHIQYAEIFLNLAEIILIDKPMDSELNRCEVFCRNAQVSKTKVYINYQRRFSICWKKIKDILRLNQFGQFLYGRGEICSYYPSWRPHKDPNELYVAKQELGGGVLLTECHEIDLLQWCLAPVKSVYSKTITSKGDEVENQAILVMDLEFPYGERPFTLLLNDKNKFTKREIELVFEEETIVVEEEKGILLLKEHDERIDFLEDENPHKELLKALLVEQEMEVPTLQDGMLVNAIVEAAKKSMISQKSEKVVCSVCPKEGVEYLEEAIRKIQEAFGEKLVAIYGLGSLGYGGYVEGWSDFDIDVLVDATREEEREVYQKGKNIEKKIQNAGFERIDIRVYNYEHLNERNTILTYGQCSRASMICDSGVLLAGKDVRNQVIRPSVQELNEEAIKLLHFMLNKDDDWWNERPWDDIAAHFALVGRFLYTADTGGVVGKQVAMEYFLTEKAHLFSQEEVQWVMWALAIRHGLNPCLIQNALHRYAIRVLRGMFQNTLIIIERKNKND